MGQSLFSRRNDKLNDSHRARCDFVFTEDDHHFTIPVEVEGMVRGERTKCSFRRIEENRSIVTGSFLDLSADFRGGDFLKIFSQQVAQSELPAGGQFQIEKALFSIGVGQRPASIYDK